MEVVKFVTKVLAYDKEISAEPQHDGRLSQVSKLVEKMQGETEAELAFVIIWVHSNNHQISRKDST